MSGILVIGSSGQLARSLSDILQRQKLQHICKGREEFDLEDLQGIHDGLDELAPSTIINAAAFTDVAAAEQNIEKVRTINAQAPRRIAAWTRKVGCRFFQISTDFVFDGSGQAPYTEEMICNPLNVYGQTKLEGEQFVMEENPEAIILRTAWLYGKTTPNFVSRILSAAKLNETIDVVMDEIGTPMSSDDLGEVIVKIMKAGEDTDRKTPKGTYHVSGHVSGSGGVSRFEFAEEILEISSRLGGPNAELLPVLANDFPSEAIRPKDTRLNCSKVERDFSIRMPAWDNRLPETVEYLLHSGC